MIWGNRRVKIWRMPAKLSVGIGRGLTSFSLRLIPEQALEARAQENNLTCPVPRRIGAVGCFCRTTKYASSDKFVF
jgi:hypothetical protein